MRIGTKILLLMLLITIGSSAVVSWIVTLNVTSHETEQANEQISLAIARYQRYLENQYHQISRITRAMIEASTVRSLLQAASDPSDKAAREQFRQEILRQDVQRELQSSEITPAFHILCFQTGEVTLASSVDAKLESLLSAKPLNLPIDAVISSKSHPIMEYISTPAGFFLTMGVPLRSQLDQPPDWAYFVGFRIDNNWIRQQLLVEQTIAESTRAPLAAWFVVDGAIAAGGSSDPRDSLASAFRADIPLRRIGFTATTRPIDHVEFDLNNERFIGQSFNLNASGAKSSQLILASSLDLALKPLRRLQLQIFFYDDRCLRDCNIRLPRAGIDDR